MLDLPLLTNMRAHVFLADLVDCVGTIVTLLLISCVTIYIKNHFLAKMKDSAKSPKSAISLSRAQAKCGTL